VVGQEARAVRAVCCVPKVIRGAQSAGAASAEKDACSGENDKAAHGETSRSCKLPLATRRGGRCTAVHGVGGHCRAQRRQQREHGPRPGHKRSARAYIGCASAGRRVAQPCSKGVPQ
jgi:hypothetical protein